MRIKVGDIVGLNIAISYIGDKTPYKSFIEECCIPIGVTEDDLFEIIFVSREYLPTYCNLKIYNTNSVLKWRSGVYVSFPDSNITSPSISSLAKYRIKNV